MNPDRRQRVVDNAKYLRNVRPLDPEEIAEYVEGHPHPAAVRQVIREEAFDLGLIEREDGTFVPVSDEPIPDGGEPVTAFPDEYTRRVEHLLVERFGPGWNDGTSADRLRERIRQFKEHYYRGRPVEYDDLAALGYAIYHLPNYYAVGRYVIDELARDGLLPRALRVLDIGAGVGGPALGLFDSLPDDALVEYHAVEPSDEAADTLNELLDETGRNVRTTVHRTTAEAFDPATLDGSEDGSDTEWDLVVLANVLSELDRPVEVTARYLDALASDGSLVAIAPADRNTSIGLRAVERALADERGDCSVYAPTVRLWPGEHPTEECWSFDVKPDLDVPPFQRALDDESGTFVNVSVRFSYAVLRPDGRRRVTVEPDPDRFARMADMDRHVTERIDILAAKLSHDLTDDGNPVLKVSDGSESVGHFAVMTRETALNRDLLAADYGDLLAFEGVLVLWNDDEEAYNLVVDDDVVVDRIPV